MAEVQKQTTNKNKSESTEDTSAAKRIKVHPAGIVAEKYPEYATSTDFLLQLLRTRVESLPTVSGKVFVAKRDDKLLEVFKGMVRENVLSVPVIAKKEHRYYGYIDLADILKYVVESFPAINLVDNWQNFWQLLDQDDLFKNKTVRDVMTNPLSLRNPFHRLQMGYSLLNGVELLAKEENLHRVAITDNERRLVTILTQSQIILFLHSNLELMGGKRNKPINLMANAIKPVMSVNLEQKTIDAFTLLTKENHVGLAVLDGEKLVGNLSLRDLKSINGNVQLFWTLYQPVRDFLNNLKKVHNRPDRLIAVKPTDTMETVIKLLSENRIHRVYVVDEESKPIGVISLKDVLLELITV